MSIKQSLRRLWHNVGVFLFPCEENNYRAHVFSTSFLAVFFFAVVFLKCSFIFFLSSFPNSSLYADVTKTALLSLTNAERIKHNLPALAENSQLSQAAYQKALDMVKNSYFDHNSPSGIQPWHWIAQSGYQYKYAGENLAIGFIDSKEVSDAWLQSPSHRANIINNKYQEIGIAVLNATFQGNPTTLVVQMFGSKPASSQKIAAADGQLPQNDSKIRNGAATPLKEVMGAQTASADPSSADFKLFSFVSQKYFDLIQAAIYVFLVFIIILLAANFALKADKDHIDLLVKTAGFIALIGIFMLMDHSLMVALIPHSLAIY